MRTIRSLKALEILDSRGRPTVQVSCELEGGARSQASVPSGASTGAAEALELRDGDPERFSGLGCLKAVAHVNEEINTALTGRPFDSQHTLDAALLELDGTANKSRLGANATLGVSLAFARAAALQDGVALHEYFSSVLHGGQPTAFRLPRPTVNLFSGGKHAGEQVPIQDVLVVPLGDLTMMEALERVFSVYQAAAREIMEVYDVRALTADEGGLAPPCRTAEAMLDLAVKSIESAGLRPGEDVALALDVASSHFFRDGRYYLSERPLTSTEMIETISDWLEAHPIVSVEDGLAEDDWEHWPGLVEAVDRRALVLGDDLLCTNPGRIRRAIDLGAADALLLKVNQIGTISEAAEALELARAAGWRVTVSARSGETEDNWLADLAVGWSGDQIKIGSITQSERLAKYNRLLAIEAEFEYPMVRWPG